LTHNAHLDAYLLSLRDNERFGYDTIRNRIIKNIYDRFSHDQVDVELFMQAQLKVGELHMM
jgi:hypothetical protein